MKFRAEVGEMNTTIARGHISFKTDMNKLEASYAEHLRKLQLVGTIHSFSFERHNLKLADKTYYKPDFEVMLPDGQIEFHEVKAFAVKLGKMLIKDDAAVKIKVAAYQFPQYVFKYVTHDKTVGWVIKPLPPHKEE